MYVDDAIALVLRPPAPDSFGTLCGQPVTTLEHARLLGITLDNQLSFGNCGDAMVLN